MNSRIIEELEWLVREYVKEKETYSTKEVDTITDNMHREIAEFIFKSFMEQSYRNQK